MSTSSDQDFLIRTGGNCSNKKSAPSNTNRDAISNLPECVISHILSRLPTRDVVRTSVLSKAWEFKWTSIYNIDVVEEEELAGSESFLKFVDRLLSHSQYIKSFCLACSDQCGYSHIENWISSVFIRNVETVEIDDVSYSEDPSQMVLPRSLLSCTSLKELMIEIACSWKVPARICFPNLTSLHLEGVQILTETDTVRFNLPVLQRCGLLRCCWSLNVKCVEIYAPALRTSFKSCPCYVEEFQNYAKVGNYTIKFDSGVQLANFEVSGSFLENFVLTRSQVSTATLKDDEYVDEMFAKCKLRYRKILNEFSSIEELSLSSLVSQAIAQTKWRRASHLDRNSRTSSCSDDNFCLRCHLRFRSNLVYVGTFDFQCIKSWYFASLEQELPAFLTLQKSVLHDLQTDGRGKMVNRHKKRKN